MEELRVARGEAVAPSSGKTEDADISGGLSKEAGNGSHAVGDSAPDHMVDGASTPSETTPPASEHISIVGPRPQGTNYSPSVLFWQFKRFFFRGVDKDIVSLQGKRNILTGDLELMHAHAAHYDNRAEYMYSFLQVMTASAASFTHGANDVSKYAYLLLAHLTIFLMLIINSAVGPYATIYYIWSTHQLKSNSPVPYWIL